MKLDDLVHACQNEWQAYTKHNFVDQLAKGSLAPSSFLHYLKQDFLFLKQYARAYALAIYKSKSLADMRHALPTLHNLLDREIGHHVAFCADWGLTEQNMEQEPEDFGTVAYTRYVLDAGMSGSLVDLYAALAPCLMGYAEIGRNLLEDKATLLEGNPFLTWIQVYSGEGYQEHAQQGIRYLNSLLSEVELTSQRGQHLIEVFRTATQMEIAFWQQGLNASEEEQHHA